MISNSKARELVGDWIRKSDLPLYTFTQNTSIRKWIPQRGDLVALGGNVIIQVSVILTNGTQGTKLYSVAFIEVLKNRKLRVLRDRRSIINQLLSIGYESSPRTKRGYTPEEATSKLLEILKTNWNNLHKLASSTSIPDGANDSFILHLKNGDATYSIVVYVFGRKSAKEAFLDKFPQRRNDCIVFILRKTVDENRIFDNFKSRVHEFIKRKGWV